MKDHTIYYPLPEAVDGGEWQVDQDPRGGGSTTLNGRGSGGSMTVPLGSSDRDRWIRFHEQGHIAYTPRRKTGVPNDIPHWLLNAVEDTRVNELLKREVGIDMPTRGMNDFEVMYEARAAMESRDPGVIAASLFSKMGLEDHDVLANAMKEYARSLPGDDSRQMRAAFDKAARSARFVHKTMIMDKHTDGLKNFKRVTVPAARMLKDLLESSGDDGMKGKDREGKEEHDRDVDRTVEEMMDALERGRYWYDGDRIPWGEMEVVELQHPLSLPARLKARKKVAYERGHIPVNMHRWCTDKKLFSRSTRRTGGSVLIDVSGSMSWSDEQVEELVNLMPGGVIGIYSGQGKSGWLRIIARDGARARPDDPAIDTHPVTGMAYGCGNIVDGPALDWLMAQEGPRYWVCDGHVTGRHDGTTKALMMDALKKVQRGRIVRLDHLESAVALVQQRKVLL